MRKERRLGREGEVGKVVQGMAYYNVGPSINYVTPKFAILDTPLPCVTLSVK